MSNQSITLQTSKPLQTSNPSNSTSISKVEKERHVCLSVFLPSLLPSSFLPTDPKTPVYLPTYLPTSIDSNNQSIYPTPRPKPPLLFVFCLPRYLLPIPGYYLSFTYYLLLTYLLPRHLTVTVTVIVTVTTIAWMSLDVLGFLG